MTPGHNARKISADSEVRVRSDWGRGTLSRDSTGHFAASGLNQTLGTLTSAQNTALTLRRTGITTGLKRMISTTSISRLP